MALSANTVWEVRQNGSDTNGGGFVTGASGTDWSQQASAQYSVTDGVTNGTTTITSATASFGTDVVGSIMYVQGGTGSVVADRYEVTARTNSTTITVDRSTGLTAGTGVTLKIGGALATLGTLGTLLQSTHITYVKYSATAYSITTSTPGAGGPLVVNGAGTGYYPRIVGYDTTRTVSNADANRPTIKAATTATYGIIETAAFNSVDICNLILDGDSRAGVSGVVEAGYPYSVVYAKRIDVINCPGGGLSAEYACDCRSNNNAWGFNLRNGVLENCTASNNAGAGFSYTSGAYGWVFRCLAYGNGGVGFALNGNNCDECTAYGNTGDGFGYVFDYVSGASVKNCVSVSNGGYGFSTTGGTYTGPRPHCLTNCATYGNTNGAISGFTAPYGYQENAIVLSSNPFENASGQNFNISLAGSRLKAAAYPTSFRGTSTYTFLDVGAVQHSDTSTVMKTFVNGQQVRG